MNIKYKLAKIRTLIISLYLTVSLGLFNLAIAVNDAKSLGAIVGNVQKSILSIVSLLIIIAYVAGVGFALAGILQFKAHKDNPTQVPLSKPIVFLAVSACLLFLPSIMSTAGKTVFGDTKSAVSDSVISGVGSVEPEKTQ